VSSTASFAPDERIRLFIGLRIPEDVLGRLGAWQDEVFGGVRDVRIVPPANVHITLAFLGHRPAVEVEPVAAALREGAAAAEQPRLTLGRYRETRSVGMLVFDDEGGAGGRLAADLHARLERIGVYEPEERPWLPHLTVVRFRGRPRLSPPPAGLTNVCPSGAAVYLSVLRPTGAQYVVVQEFGL